jgi:galactokinase
MHVLTEAERVEIFAKLCADGGDEDKLSVSLGNLMNDSQKSCHQLYDCSSVCLNEIT